ncbi:MAG: J domain-containing protein [Hyphomicrobiaceae bacterium]
MIRIRRVPPPEARDGSNHARCRWKGCERAGLFRAPAGRGREGLYYLFCADHIRQYNASYNYFDGMSDAELEQFHKDAACGHRPTWKVGANAWAHGTFAGPSQADSGQTRQAKGFHSWRIRRQRDNAGTATPRRALKPIEQKSLETLNLPHTATREEIKARFKELVKRHHPDSNGGDRACEDRLRQIIQAYNYLKQTGLA